MPEIGKTYRLYLPFGVVRVTRFVRNWIHIEPGDGRESFDGPVVQKRGRIPTRIKAKHWAGKVRS